MGPSLNAMPGSGSMGSGGIGILEVLLIGGLIFLIFRLLIQKAAARSIPDSQSGMSTGKTFESESGPSGAEELMRKARAEREYTPQNRFESAPPPAEDHAEPMSSETAMDLFFQVQAGWMNRDLNSIYSILDYEARDYLDHEIARLKSRGVINRLENIAIRSTDVVESWRDGNRNYSTIRFSANLLDYTLDEKTQQVIEGSKTQPVKFEEYWTFSKNVFDSQWKLSAIQQPE
jgi:predicted lipid-binding transport protein (Tim44 family)